MQKRAFLSLSKGSCILEMACKFFLGRVGIMMVGLGQSSGRINEYFEEMKKKSGAVYVHSEIALT